MKRNWKRKIPLIILLAATGMAAFTGIVMLLWNSILPAVLHAGMITFWQAAGLLLLARILFGGMKGRRYRMAGGCQGRHANMTWENKGNCGPQVAGQE